MVNGIWKRIVFEIRMQVVDARWRHSFRRSCWELYPPSFYYRHTKEEVAKIWEQDKHEVMQLLEEYTREYGLEVVMGDDGLEST